MTPFFWDMRATIWDNVMASSSMVEHLKVRPLLCLEKLRKEYKVMQHRIPEEWCLVEADRM
jgi:hypothetical protein